MLFPHVSARVNPDTFDLIAVNKSCHQLPNDLDKYLKLVQNKRKMEARQKKLMQESQVTFTRNMHSYDSQHPMCHNKRRCQVNFKNHSQHSQHHLSYQTARDLFLHPSRLEHA